MSSGSYYVNNRYAYDEEYSSVAAYSVPADNGIPSGASIVRGIYYMWNDEGFTGQGWMTNVDGGPTAMYPSFKSDNDVVDYISRVGNLDAVFSFWAQHYTLVGWDNFYMAVGIESGCMNVDHSQG